MAEQLALAGMPRRLFMCTPSRLAAFDCPRRYRMTYLDRPTPSRGAPWAHNTVGAAVHVALARWFSSPARERSPDRASQLVTQAWQADGFRDAAQSGRWRDRAAGWTRRYIETVPQPDEPVGVERTVAVTTDGLAVSGRVDRIDERSGELVVVDYKTGRRRLTDDDAASSQALALYVLAARRTFRRACHRVELHHLPTGEVASFEHTEASLARQVVRAEASAQDIVAATDTLAGGADPDDVFPPITGSGCSWCDFRTHCPEGQAASVGRTPWAALGED